MESPNDVIIQNLVVPSAILANGNPTEVGALNLQHQEPTLSRVASTAIITDTRSSAAVNNTSCITSCQSTTKPVHVSQVLQEQPVVIEEMRVAPTEIRVSSVLIKANSYN